MLPFTSFNSLQFISTSPHKAKDRKQNKGSAWWVGPDEMKELGQEK